MAEIDVSFRFEPCWLFPDAGGVLLDSTLSAATVATVFAVVPPAGAAAVFQDNFSDGNADGWALTGASWAVAADDGNPALAQSSATSGARAIATNVGRGTTFGTIVQARLKPRSTLGAAGSVALLFDAVDANNYAYVALRATRIELGRRVHGALSVVASAPYTPTVGAWQVVTLSPRDLGRQVWYLRASLATVAGLLPAPVQRRHRVPAHTIGEDAFVAAGSIADRLCDDALGVDGSGPDWVSVNVVDGRWWTIGPTDLGLTAGVCGIALFLAELDATRPHATGRRVAERIIRTVLSADDEPEVSDLAGMSAGRYEDLGALLHLLLRLQKLWGTAAPRIPHWLGAAILQNYSCSPSHLATLLALHGVAPSDKTLRAVRHMVDELPSYEPLPASPWGDRRADQASALAALGDVTGERMVADAAWRALASGCSAGTPATPVGEALACARMLRLPVMAAYRPGILEHLRRATAELAATAHSGLGRDALVDGDLGVVEALTVSGAALDEPGTFLLAGRLAAAVSARVVAGEIRTAVPTGVWNPGLLIGAAGIGLGLVRAARPNQVAGVLG